MRHILITLQMRSFGFKNVKICLQIHTTIRWQIWDLNLGVSGYKAAVFSSATNSPVSESLRPWLWMSQGRNMSSVPSLALKQRSYPRVVFGPYAVQRHRVYCERWRKQCTEPFCLCTSLHCSQVGRLTVST